MIDLNDFNLIYLRKVDGVKFLVRHVTKYDSMIICSLTGIISRLTWYYLAKDYTPSKANKKNKKRHFMNFGKKRLL